MFTVEQVITDDTYTVAVHLGDTTLTVSPEAAEALAYDLTEAALEPDRCLDCGNYAAPTAEHCPRHLADAGNDRCQQDAGSRPWWMSPDQYDPCRCTLPSGHDVPHTCDHLESKRGGL